MRWVRGGPSSSSSTPNREIPSGERRGEGGSNFYPNPHPVVVIRDEHDDDDDWDCADSNRDGEEESEGGSLSEGGGGVGEGGMVSEEKKIIAKPNVGVGVVSGINDNNKNDGDLNAQSADITVPPLPPRHAFLFGTVRLRAPAWSYFIIAFLDVQGHYLMYLAYRYTTPSCIPPLPERERAYTLSLAASSRRPWRRV